MLSMLVILSLSLLCVGLTMRSVWRHNAVLGLIYGAATFAALGVLVTLVHYQQWTQYLSDDRWGTVWSDQAAAPGPSHPAMLLSDTFMQAPFIIAATLLAVAVVMKIVEQARHKAAIPLSEDSIRHSATMR